MKNQPGSGFFLQDPFLITRSRVMKLGALTGLIGEVIGLLITYFVLLSRSNSEETIYLTIGFFTLICFPMPSFLIGAAIGALIGRFSVKRSDETNYSKTFSHARLFGIIGVIGFTIGILPLVYFGINFWESLTGVSSPDWSADGKRIAFSSPRGGNDEIYVINADGSGLVQVTNGPGRKHSPAWSPDDSQIVLSYKNGYYNEIYKINADGTNLVKLTPEYSGHEFWPSWSPNGRRIAYISGVYDREIFSINADGTAQKQLTNIGGFSPSWSPTGRQIVFSSRHDGNAEIYVMNSAGSYIVRLTNNTQDDLSPVWSPDGSRIAFVSGNENHHEVYVMNTDGSHRTQVTNNGNDNQDPTWSPDGSRIMFVFSDKDKQQIVVMNADGSHQTQITNNSNDNRDPTWSPDGSRIAFVLYSGFPGMPDIYTVNVNGSEVILITR